MTNYTSGQRRRVIYMDDETWAKVGTESANAGISMSDYIRQKVTAKMPMGINSGAAGWETIPGKMPSEQGPKITPGQAPRSVTAPPAQERFSTRAFTPVPKKAK